MTPALPTDATLEAPALPKLPTYRHPRRLVAAGLAAGALGNGWFVDAPLGVGFFVFALGWVIALRALGGLESWQRAGSTKLLLAPLLVFAGFVAIRDSPTLTMLNVLAVAALAALAVQSFTGEQRLTSLGVRGYIASTLGGLFRSAFAGPVVVADSVNVGTSVEVARTYARPVFRAALFAVPVLALFGALLISADAVFSRLITERLGALLDGDWASAITTIGVVGGIGVATTGLWATALRRRPAVVTAKEPASGARLQAVESFAIVGSLLVLFAGFSAIQAACLFGHVALPADMTWAEYARQGFFQLLAVAGLTLALLTGLSRLVFLPAAQQRFFQLACTALVGLTWLILASAVKRLTLYEEAYGFTELRVFSHVFAFALAGMLLWRAVTMWALRETFATGAMAGLIAFVLALDMLNPDAFIARKNLERFADSGVVDGDYLAGLSADADDVMRAAGRPRTLSAREGGGWASANLARWSASR
jgi:hypothetical protein